MLTKIAFIGSTYGLVSPLYPVSAGPRRTNHAPPPGTLKEPPGKYASGELGGLPVERLYRSLMPLVARSQMVESQPTFQLSLLPWSVRSRFSTTPSISFAPRMVIAVNASSGRSARSDCVAYLTR